MSDGLTVPFALAAGLSGAVDSTRVVITAGLADALAHDAAHAISKNRKSWIDFMMRFELGLEEPDPRRARTSALTIALSYVAGGLVPLAPYFFFQRMMTALEGPIIVTLAALLLFGYVKGRFTVKKPLRSAWQTAVVGGLAAAAAFAIAKFIA